ncbi:siroheme decarboxylase subunit beta [Cellulosilyticum sp. I15G10I2]|uniref:siroheme decarboxylase subunit beta n=1 Tax=Cellulosilyticum sp. I15G10I2 TaxID=1892843 RepID=UPI00085C4DF9|nr:Lrp/AsnC family transcriptional regulator [Cellulosilyticum sp. I15G10I2]
MKNILERAIVRRLQEDLPLVPEPYKYIADELGISEQELLDKLKEMQDKKYLRRIGCILHHRAAGFKANAMVVWEVPKDSIFEVTDIITSFPQVSHCYERETLPDWSYNIYSMIHAETFEKCEAIIVQIISKVSIYKYEVLYSTKELKKSSMKYFAEAKYNF